MIPYQKSESDNILDVWDSAVPIHELVATNYVKNLKVRWQASFGKSLNFLIIIQVLKGVVHPRGQQLKVVTIRDSESAQVESLYTRMDWDCLKIYAAYNFEDL